MQKLLGLGLTVVFMLLLALPALAAPPHGTAPKWDRNPKAFVHGIALQIDGEYYYFAGPGSVQGKIDIPGHTWLENKEAYYVKGRHYNVGPWMYPDAPWWASGESYGVLLYIVDGIIARWSMEIAEEMAARGYVHYHELVNATGHKHPTLVVWLKHTAVRFFHFDGGPHPPKEPRWVTPGIDYEFMPNWMKPYDL